MADVHRIPADQMDLATQLEELLGAVRTAEANWRFDDRLDLAEKLERRNLR
jgi:hypothetical protein